MNAKKYSETLSSNWYHKYKIPYLLLIADVLILILISFFSLKGYLVGNYEYYYPNINSLLVLLIFLISIVFRFNLSILLFEKQKTGLYLSLLFVLLALYVEIFTNTLSSPLMLLGIELVSFIDKFLFPLSEVIKEVLLFSLYVYVYYVPVLVYLIFMLFKIPLNNDAKKFDVLTGFYGATVSSKLRVLDLVILFVYIFIAMSIGLISDDIKWGYLLSILSIFLVRDLFEKLNMTEMKSKAKNIIYIYVFVSSIFLVFFQRIPFLGMFSILIVMLIGYLIFQYYTKNWLKSLIVSLILFFIIPIFTFGYNVFSNPQYGIINKSIPIGGEKVFFEIVDKDGNLGIRGRSRVVVKPIYKEIYHLGKDIVKLKDENDKWHTYNTKKLIFED